VELNVLLTARKPYVLPGTVLGAKMIPTLPAPNRLAVYWIVQPSPHHFEMTTRPMADAEKP
jgi:hypothetical protein